MKSKEILEKISVYSKEVLKEQANRIKKHNQQQVQKKIKELRNKEVLTEAEEQFLKDNVWGIIYKTTCLLNNKIYVGQHCRFDRDYNDKYLGSGTDILKALDFYGSSNFKREVLGEFLSLNALNVQEIYWIDRLGACDPKIGYNRHIGGGGFSEQNVVKMLLTRKLNDPNNEYLAKGVKTCREKGIYQTRAKKRCLTSHKKSIKELLDFKFDEKFYARCSSCQEIKKLYINCCSMKQISKIVGTHISSLKHILSKMICCGEIDRDLLLKQLEFTTDDFKYITNEECERIKKERLLKGNSRKNKTYKEIYGAESENILSKKDVGFYSSEKVKQKELLKADVAEQRIEKYLKNRKDSLKILKYKFTVYKKCLISLLKTGIKEVETSCCQKTLKQIDDLFSKKFLNISVISKLLKKDCRDVKNLLESFPLNFRKSLKTDLTFEEYCEKL